jgi:large subunit ribosomal protein L4
MKLALLNNENKQVGDIEISDDVLLAEPNAPLAHQLLLLQHTRPFRNARTKTKGEVRGGGAKPWKQKGTGRARAGSIRSPLWKGGGVTFGPRFHEITVKMPRRMRLKALCSALSLKKEQLFIFDAFPKFTAPKTKEALAVINKLPAQDKKVLVIIDKAQESHGFFQKSIANLPKVRVIHWQNLNVHDLVNADVTVTDQASIKNIETWLLGWKDRKGSKVESGGTK